jgi:hypothetical protein
LPSCLWRECVGSAAPSAGARAPGRHSSDALQEDPSNVVRSSVRFSKSSTISMKPLPSDRCHECAQAAPATGRRSRLQRPGSAGSAGSPVTAHVKPFPAARYAAAKHSRARLHRRNKVLLSASAAPAGARGNGRARRVGAARRGRPLRARGRVRLRVRHAGCAPAEVFTLPHPARRVHAGDAV